MAGKTDRDRYIKWAVIEGEGFDFFADQHIDVQDHELIHSMLFTYWKESVA